MKVAHICQTPIAGACWAWSEAFKEAGYESFSVALKSYGDGRDMPADRRWPPNTTTIDRIRAADLICCHQGKPYRADWYPRGKPTLGIYHSQPNHVCRLLEGDGWPWAVVGQYQTRLYPGCYPAPNLIPLKHRWYQSQAKPSAYVRIAYSPSNRHLRGWDDKGYDQTLEAINNVIKANGYGCQADILTTVSLEECLQCKAEAHIVIDECITGSYHRSSLEALALGCVVVNNCDWKCDQNIKQMTGGAGNPFEVVDLDGLEDRLQKLVARGPQRLAEAGQRNRVWAETAWEPSALIARNLAPLMDAAMERAA